MPESDWNSFWKKPNTAFAPIMQVSTDYFFQQLIKRHPLKPGDSVLDYGCGPGLLIKDLVRANVIVTGADINEMFLNENRGKFPGAEFILITDKFDLAGRHFDLIVLLSVIQYFPSPGEVERVLKILKEHLHPGGKIIMADVVTTNTSSVRDAIAIFIRCLIRGRAIAFARFLLYLMFSDYREISKKNNLLLLSPEFFDELGARCGFLVDEAKNMTPHPTRTNYIFTLNDPQKDIVRHTGI